MRVLILCLIAICGLSKYVESASVFCEFKESSSYGYECEVKYLTITSKEDRTITEAIGYHASGKNNRDVKYFHSINHIVKFFPLGLATIFNNLENVYIHISQLSEIHSSDLKQFGDKLKKLWLTYNAIEVLESDLFQYNPNLNYIDFISSKIKHIDDGTFRGLEQLSQLYLNGGLPCIDKGATTRSDVITLITEAEIKCKDYTSMLNKHKEETRAQLDEMNKKLLQQDAKLLKCRCESP